MEPMERRTRRQNGPLFILTLIHAIAVTDDDVRALYSMTALPPTSSSGGFISHGVTMMTKDMVHSAIL